MGLRELRAHERDGVVVAGLVEAEHIQEIRDNDDPFALYPVRHLDYARYRQEGLPIGSGCMESACKWLIQQRFKGVGMRWSESGLNHLLHLRLAWTNERFESLFEQTSPNL